MKDALTLICPCCGSPASAEAWTNEKNGRELLAAVATLPHPLPEAILSYLPLFRPVPRALSLKKALRLIRELAALVGSGYVQVQGKVARPCQPRIWALAIEDMSERRGGLTLPISGHNYLRKVAYDLADRESLKAERSRNEDERSGNFRSRNPLADLMGFDE